MAIVISNLQETVAVDDKLLSLVQRVVESALDAEETGARVELGVALVDDEYIQELNRRFRGQDRPTDVLAFPMREEEPADAGDESGVFVLGDVVISLPAAGRQAAEYGHDLPREVARLAVHGTLHLLGYDHENDPDAQRMREREDDVLRRVGA
jgi:probable rRNA maturation factor